VAENPAPVTVDVERTSGVTLTWADGSTSRYGLEELRQLVLALQQLNDLL